VRRLAHLGVPRDLNPHVSEGESPLTYMSAIIGEFVLGDGR
jgi:hypothetical protein